MAPAKDQFKTVDEYVDSFPEPVKGILQTLRKLIKEEVPEAEETIKYAMPTYVFHGNLVYFAAWKKHIGFYPITREMEANIRALAAYKTSGKGTIQFPYSQPLPADLIRTIIRFRVKEHLASKVKEQK